MSGIEHHDKPMYRDYHDGQDMLRVLCAEPGCQAILWKVRTMTGYQNDVPETAITAMCECAHHWNVHAESNLTAQTAICHGYTGSATPGPLRQPCRCTGFAQWTGPRDSRTGEPVKPLTLTVDARIQPQVNDDVPETAITACDRCPAPALWSVQNLEGPDMQPITRWFACGKHINAVLRDGQWETDTVQVMRLEEESNW